MLSKSNKARLGEEGPEGLPSSCFWSRKWPPFGGLTRCRCWGKRLARRAGAFPPSLLLTLSMPRAREAPESPGAFLASTLAGPPSLAPGGPSRLPGLGSQAPGEEAPLTP
jgi:hypothetical protein